MCFTTVCLQPDKMIAVWMQEFMAVSIQMLVTLHLMCKFRHPRQFTPPPSDDTDPQPCILGKSFTLVPLSPDVMLLHWP